MRALLIQQGLFKVLSGKDKLSESMLDDKKEELEMKAHSALQLCLADEVRREVANEDIAAGLWLKLESLYIIKYITNKLYLKQRLFTLRMKEGGVLRVSKCSLVVMKGKKVNILYILEGSTVTSVAAVSSSEDSDSDTTRLWHMFGVPPQVPSKDRAHFLLTFIDDYSKKVWVYPLKHKSDVFATFK
ncbi:uncharacterized protein LOC109835038 [Asparagus officinalis]|uniref:uncharacterized protein LOC109835038 n=1 Tax=Asparagus officinalis TaxID=4686 RepID=UPI00098E0605|nr:uncharacterized protein LOC109835038 [Asparagus officinalis]